MPSPEEYQQDSARGKIAAKIRPWPTPLICAAHPECDLCSWAYNPTLGGTDTPMVIKHVNRNCRHSLALIQAQNKTLMDLVRLAG